MAIVSKTVSKTLAIFGIARAQSIPELGLPEITKTSYGASRSLCIKKCLSYYLDITVSN